MAGYERGVLRPGTIPAGRSPVAKTGKIDLCEAERHDGTPDHTPPRGDPFPKIVGVFIGRRAQAGVQRRPRPTIGRTATFQEGSA
jgi:hypothetical protein